MFSPKYYKQRKRNPFIEFLFLYFFEEYRYYTRLSLILAFLPVSARK